MTSPSLDIAKLRAIVDVSRERMTLEEVHYQLDALPELLAMAEAVSAFRRQWEQGGPSTSAIGHLFRVVDPGWKHDKPTLPQLDMVYEAAVAAVAMRNPQGDALLDRAVRAVDAARKEHR